MDAFAVPGDVVEALAAVGCRAVSSVGASAWLARPDAGAPTGSALDGPVEVHVVPVVVDAEVARRIDALVALRHPHLPLVHAVLPLSAGRVGLVVEHTPGSTLAELRAARAPLSEGEAATVTIPVTEALAALHERGLTHGALRAEAVVVGPDGRPVLVDLRGAILGGGSVDGDLRRLLATVLDAMPGADVELLAGPATHASLRGALEGLLVEPGMTSAAVVDTCFAATEPEPVRLPDAGALAWARVAGPGRRPAPEPLGGGSPARRAQRSARGPARRRRLARVASVVVGVAVGAGAIAGVAAHRSSGPGPRDAPVGVAAASVGPGAGRGDPVVAAEALTRARARALVGVDAASLGTVDAPGSPALAADGRLVEGLHARALDGLTVEVHAHAQGTPGADSATVVVTSTMSGYVLVGQDGSRTARPAGSPRTVVLELRRAVGGPWLVWDVRAP